MAEETLAERRRGERIPLFLPLTEINGQRAAAGNYLVNLSEFGAKLETPLAFAPGEQVEFSFTPPGEAKETRCKGKIVWVLPSPLTQGHHYLGLELIGAPAGPVWNPKKGRPF